VRTYPRPGSRPGPSKSRAPSGMSLTIRRNSRERRRGSKQGAGEVADRLRVFDPGCRLRVNATQRRRANHHIRLFSSNAGQSRELFSAGRRHVRVRAESIQGRKRVHNADEPPGGERRQARLSNVFERALPRTSYGFGDSTFC
jgi:hypothetical protein